MNLAELRAYKPQIMEIASKYGVGEIKVFGSVARGDADENSDVDLLVDRFDGSLLRFSSFKLQIADLIGKKVDLFKQNNIKHPLVIESINRDLKLL